VTERGTKGVRDEGEARCVLFRRGEGASRMILQWKRQRGQIRKKGGKKKSIETVKSIGERDKGALLVGATAGEGERGKQGEGI